MSRARAVALGLGLDAALGEPPVEPHPVAAFGSAMSALEARWWADDSGRGVAHLAAGVGLAAVVGRVVRSTTLATYVSVAGRSLGDVALGMVPHLEADDLDGARHEVRALVGRDTGGLDRAALTRAVIESVAENTVDAVVAPALWAAVGGAPGALAYRAVNTLDAMVGHRSARYERFGWASARADDLANWVPARVTAALVVASRPSAAAAVRTAVRRDAPAHPSPNGGVAEAAYAAALGLRLGGTNRYGDRTEARGTLGDGRPPEPSDVVRAVDLLRDVTTALAAGLLVGSAAADLVRRARADTP